MQLPKRRSSLPDVRWQLGVGVESAREGGSMPGPNRKRRTGKLYITQSSVGRSCDSPVTFATIAILNRCSVHAYNILLKAVKPPPADAGGHDVPKLRQYMALNPFRQLSQISTKIWMVTILLLCMVTFVLCTGTKGDFMDWVLNLTRPKGTVVGKIDGSSLYSSELHDIKTRRNIANEFMTKGRIRLLERIDEFPQAGESEEVRDTGLQRQKCTRNASSTPSSCGSRSS